MKEKDYKSKTEENKIKKVSELLKVNNLTNQKIIPHSAILSNIEETIAYYNDSENKDKKSVNNISGDI